MDDLRSLMEAAVVKEGVMVPGNGVIIVIQDKDAYCKRPSV